MKKAIIIACFYNYSYDVRIKYLESYLEELGYTVRVLTSDFDHREKQYYAINKENVDIIHVPFYSRNLSIKRLYSHWKFAKETYNKLVKEQPDVVYAITPPNIIYRYLHKYKNNNTVKLICEIDDMWPESLPLSGSIKRLMAPILYLWGSLRNRYLHKVDGVVFECNLFRDKLIKHLADVKNETIYMCKKDYFTNSFPIKEPSSNVLTFAYIGSINNIIDIELIVGFLKEISTFKEVFLKIVGNGERLNDLQNLCEKEDIDYKYYGPLYSDDDKKSALSDCDYAFNLMKDSVFVGATMKSLEYFHWGLVVINNIKGDTSDIIEDYRCGVNINWFNYKDVAKSISNYNQNTIKELKMNSRKVYDLFFSEKALKEKYMCFLKEIL